MWHLSLCQKLGGGGCTDQQQLAGLRICPLVPLLLSACPGTLSRELNELATWYDHIYENNTEGVHDLWVGLAAALGQCSDGAVSLENMDAFKVILPSSLASPNLDNCVTFCSNSSRPNNMHGFSKDSCDELLRSLLTSFYTNFRACTSPESYLARAPSNSLNSETVGQNVILAGASNLKYSAKHFTGVNLTFRDISSPGWVANPNNIAGLCA